jgi:hypothetical protein
MLKKTIKYKDFTGEETTEDFYFNLTKAELIELEVSAQGNSLSAWLDKITRAQNGAEIIGTFKKIISTSFGVKSPDGRRFIKSPEILAEFESTVAYSDLFMELATDAEKGAEFVNGLMPEGMTPGQVATDIAGLTASEAARKASEARLQGHRPAQEKSKPSVERQPELPTVLETAPPVLEAKSQPEAATTPEPDLSLMSREEVIAYYHNQN